MLSKIFLMGVFVGIYLLFSVIARQKTWLAMVGGFVVAMLLFMMIPALTPLDATAGNVLLCLIAGVLFSAGLGAASSQVLGKTSLV
jgi:CDP-diglyceride synthetase